MYNKNKQILEIMNPMYKNDQLKPYHKTSNIPAFQRTSITVFKVVSASLP